MLYRSQILTLFQNTAPISIRNLLGLLFCLMKVKPLKKIREATFETNKKPKIQIYNVELD